MIDYSKLTQIVDGKAEPKKAPKKGVSSKKPCVIADSKKEGKKEVPTRKPKVSREEIMDSISKKRAARKYNTFKVTDSYKNYKKRIKDALEDTETTDDAVAVAVEALNEVPADQAIAAVVEVLGEAIDILQGQACPNGECDAIPEEAEEAPVEEEVEDSAKNFKRGAKKVKDGLNVTVTNGSGETVEVNTDGGDSVISAPEAPIAEPPIETGSPEDELGIEGEEPAIPVGDSAEEDAMHSHEDDVQGKILELLAAGKHEEATEMLKNNEYLLNAIMDK